MSGVCVPDGSGSLCGQGTVLDPATNECEIDPNACAEGTVLVGGACVDPGEVTPDVEEGAEPNGLSILQEDSVDPAGQITIGAVGESFVAHGKIIPFQDSDDDGQDDPDVDTFTLSVTSPTLLTVTIDGVHGLAGAFLSIAAVDSGPLANWVRAGVNLTGDTSKRQLFLPAAGTYAVAITDSRTLFLGGAAGALDGAPELEYFATFTNTEITTSALTVTAGEATSTGVLAPGEVKFFTVPMDLGFAAAILDTPADEITGSLVVTNVSGTANQLKAIADEDEDVGDPAFITAIGFRTGDTTTFVADHVINTALQDVDYQLDVVTGGATALSTTGTAVTAPTDFAGNNVFFRDVTTANQIDGIDIAFDIPVAAQIFDENNNVFSNMTIDPSGVNPPDTMTAHAGFFRYPAPGRYYWVTFDDNFVATEVDATSTITPTTPTVITKGTPTGNVNVNQTFESNIFSYDPVIATDAWQQFTASSTGAGAGNVVLRYFDPATSFGRLDDLATGSGTCSPDCDDTSPVFQTSHLANGGTTTGRILLDDNTATYLVTANTPTPAGTINLTFARRPHTDIGSKNATQTDARADQPLSTGTVAIQRYLVRTARDNEVQVVATPTALLDVRIQQLNNDETSRGALVNNAIAGGAETATLYQAGDGWTAWTVTPALVPVTAENFDQDVTILASFYTVADTATAFSDACTGGTVVAVANTNNATSGILSAPASFDLFGTAAPSFRVSTNGFLNFVTAQTGSFPGHFDLPSTTDPDGLVAPFWTDLAGVQICSKTAGTKLTIQWTGVTVAGGTRVEFQAILDGSNDSIELVYGPNHAATGEVTENDVGATIGVENLAGTKSKVIGFDEAAVTASSSQRFTLTP